MIENNVKFSTKAQTINLKNFIVVFFFTFFLWCTSVHAVVSNYKYKVDF